MVVPGDALLPEGRRVGARGTGCGQYKGQRQHCVAAWKSGRREAGEP